MLYFISYTLLNRETISPSPCYALGVDLSFSPHWFFHKPSTPMLYYYTTISAMRSILRNARIWGMICFGTTRYDGFADAEGVSGMLMSAELG